MRTDIRPDFLPFAVPSISEDEIAEVVDTLRSGWITTGPKTKQFEDEFAAACGARYAIAVNSNTAGLHVALAALNIGVGDEVIVPSLTFCATANVVVQVGAKPILVEVNDDLNIDPQSVASAVTDRTKAIMVVHYGGQPADLEQLRALAAPRGIRIIEDCAHVVGAKYRGRTIGSDSDMAVFSFYANKNLTTAEGGMIVTSDASVVDRLRRLSLHGMDRDAWKRYSEDGRWGYDVSEAGFKYNMTDIQASIGIHQLRRLTAMNARRIEIARLYSARLSRLPLGLPITHSDREHNWHLYVVRFDTGRDGPTRDDAISWLKEARVGTSVHYIPLHMHSFYQKEFGYSDASLPRTTGLFKQILSLPLYPSMIDADVEYVCSSIKELFDRG